jgi:hypothetical protein
MCSKPSRWRSCVATPAEDAIVRADQLARDWSVAVWYTTDGSTFERIADYRTIYRPSCRTLSMTVSRCEAPMNFASWGFETDVPPLPAHHAT